MGKRRRRQRSNCSQNKRTRKVSRSKKKVSREGSLFLSLLKHPIERWLLIGLLFVLLLFGFSVIETLKLIVN
ncbi:hypothetical protein I6N95_04300 [Vagococcus sp. BWB3-3]|uniref:Uncharacterized protein n=1 Tax=Vagococcus allomyrinae TaxID=2794353 RepID=A0A940STZ8_9ENTE|nr:hypothetical protein [Vagococcus allomyrinae]MBP1040229.1 hypothetical protein [Vagococcus allomyrinae]